ncbi:hypothetical protein FOB60_005160 [Candida parapsilosis]|uniref:Aminotransferase class V domain-containing protein n=1 Tax=Candida parapsilosis TaxID=5480 RepID=A0A8X7NHB0_CANPA|nr:hypothetical protein FOB60_005160 [Candida parapsilosis]
MPAPFQYKQPEHRLTLIPGPIEFSDDVLASMAIPSQAHTSPDFIYTFQYVLQTCANCLKSTDANTQGYVLSGSGTLGWDVAATTLLNSVKKLLVCQSVYQFFYASERALSKALNKEKDTTFFASLKRWTPIMKAYESGSGAYFATPAVQTITALKTSLEEIFAEGLDKRLATQAKKSDEFKAKVKEFLTILPKNDKVAAHGLTAVYFPEGVNGPDLLKKLGEKGYTVAGGIHKKLVGKYSVLVIWVTRFMSVILIVLKRLWKKVLKELKTISGEIAVVLLYAI